MLNEECGFAAASHTTNRAARLSQLIPLGQLLALEYHFYGQYNLVRNSDTLRKVNRLAKYQRSQRRGDLGPPSTSAHWRACTKIISLPKLEKGNLTTVTTAALQTHLRLWIQKGDLHLERVNCDIKNVKIDQN